MHAFSRTEMLIGPEGLEILARSRVAVFGIGGVGTFVVEGLARAGVGGFQLVDHDCVCLSNLNRQIHATVQTLGRPKVEAMRERVLAINPAAEVTALQRFYRPEDGDELLAPGFSYVVDAVDNVTAKLDIIVRAKAHATPVISSMGAGNKFDPALFEVADIARTSVCPLARVIRQELRKRGVGDVKVVFSREKPQVPRPPDIADGRGGCCCPSCSAPPSQDGPARRAVPGSMSFVPSVAGLIIAGVVVRDLLGITPSV